MERVDALSDSRQLVLDAWTLVNEGFYDPEKFDEIQWKRIRQKTLQKQIETSEEAYLIIFEITIQAYSPNLSFRLIKLLISTVSIPKSIFFVAE